ncbi:MAG: ClbS/DfsB family four-helix bundle protein [Chloroflexota bacterium]
MPRPTSKTDLLTAIDQERGALEAILEALTPEQMVEPGVVGEWSVKDVLAHLVEWEQMVLEWYRAGLRGDIPEMPAPGYKWNQTPQLNQMIYKKHHDRPLDKVMEEFHASHREILGVIQDLSNEELFTAGRYAWTQKNTMGTYFVSATSGHYLWARKEIRKGLKAKGG